MALKKDSVKTITAAVVLNSTGTYVENQAARYDSALDGRNALAPALLNQYKQTLETITDRLGDLNSQFDQDGLTLTVGSKIRQVERKVDDKVAAAISAQYLADTTTKGIIAAKQFGLAIYPVSFDNLGVGTGSEIYQRTTLPASQIDAEGNVINEDNPMPVAITGSLTEYNFMYSIGSGTALGRNSVFSKDIYQSPQQFTRLYIQPNSAVLLDLNTQTLEDRTCEAAQKFDTRTAEFGGDWTDEVSGACVGYFVLRAGFHLPVFSGVSLGENTTVTIFMARNDGVGGSIQINTQDANEDHVEFHYDGEIYYTYTGIGGLLQAIGLDPTKARDVETRVYLKTKPSNSNEEKYMFMKYAFYPERWIGVGLNAGQLFLKYSDKYEEDTAESRKMFRVNETTELGEVNPQYDRYLPQPVGSATRVDLNEDEDASGLVLYDIYVHPLYVLAGTAEPPLEQRAIYISSQENRNIDGIYGAYGASAIAPASNYSVATPMQNIWSIGKGDYLDIKISGTRYTINPNIGTPNPIIASTIGGRQFKFVQFFERSALINSHNLNITNQSTYFAEDTDPNSFVFNYRRKNYIALKVYKEQTDAPLTESVSLVTRILPDGGSTVQNVEIAIPTSAEVISALGYEPTAYFLFLSFDKVNGLVDVFYDSMLEEPASELNVTTRIDQTDVSTGIKGHHITYMAVAGSGTIYTEGDAAGEYQSGVIYDDATAVRSKTAASVGKIKHIIPKSIGAADLGDQCITERLFPGNNSLPNYLHRLKADHILRRDSVTGNEIEHRTEEDIDQGLSLTAINARKIKKENIGRFYPNSGTDSNPYVSGYELYTDTEAMAGSAGISRWNINLSNNDDSHGLCARDIPMRNNGLWPVSIKEYIDHQVGLKVGDQWGSTIENSNIATLANSIFGSVGSTLVNEPDQNIYVTGTNARSIDNIGAAQPVDRYSLVTAVAYMSRRLLHLERNIMAKKIGNQSFRGDISVYSASDILIAAITSTAINLYKDTTVSGNIAQTGNTFTINDTTLSRVNQVAGVGSTAGLLCSREFSAQKVWNLTWNDYADFQELKDKEQRPGFAYVDTTTGATVCYKRCQLGVIGICSDTYGNSVGSAAHDHEVPIAVAGWCLAHVDKEYPTGTALVNDIDGRLTKARWYEKMLYPERIIATYKKKEKQKEWGNSYKKIVVNGRSWVQVK